MEVVVDGRTGLVTPPEKTPIREILGAIRKSIAEQGRVVVSFTLDGETLSAERQLALLEKESGAYSLLEVKTIDPREVSAATLLGLASHMDNLKKSHGEAAALLEAGQYAKALDRFDSCLGGWDTLVRVVRDVGALASADFRTLKSGGRTVEDHFHGLQEVLLRFASAMDVKDMRRLGELYAQELRPQLDLWSGVVGLLRSGVSS